MLDLPEYKEYLIAFLAIQFGGLDFWRLSKPWKQQIYEQTATILIRDQEYMRGYISQLEQYITDNNLAIPEYDGRTA